MKLHLTALGLALCALTTSAVLAADPATGTQSAANSTSAKDTSIFGTPLFVNGQRVTDNEIKRFLINGPCRMQLELFRVALIINEELSSRAAGLAEGVIATREGLAPFGSADERARAVAEETQKQRSLLDEQTVVGEDEFESEFKKTLDEFKENYPVLDTSAEIGRAFRTVDWYRDHLKLTLRFDKVFYPVNPEEWPETTIESLRADSGQVLLDDGKESYKMRKEYSEKTGEPMVKEDGIYLQMMRQIVRDGMFNTIDWRTSYDGIPDDLVLTADSNFDGKPELTIKTEDLWNKVKDTVSESEIEEAKQWFATAWSVRDRLKSEGFLPDAAATKAALATLNKTFEGTYFNLEILATQTYYFPSTESYKDYYVMMDGFKKVMEPKLQSQATGELPQPMQDYLPVANNIMGLGQVDVEIMLVSAFDIPHFKWKPDGWAWAKKQAAEIKDKLDANIAAYNAERAAAAQAKAEGKEHKPEKEVEEPYKFWTRMMDDHSEYWDPPSPAGKGQKGSDVGMKNRGRFGLKYRNDMQGFVGETPYRHWVTGESITDFTFSKQGEGTVAGPFKGPLGYYVTRVQRRTPPSRPLNLGDPGHVKLLREDFLRVAFVDYAKESVSKAKVEGL